MKLIGRRRFTSDPFRYEGVVYGCDFIESRYVTDRIHTLLGDVFRRTRSWVSTKPPLQIDEQASAELRRV